MRGKQRTGLLLLVAGVAIVPVCVFAASVEAEIADALRKNHSTTETIQLIGKPTKYALANVYCGRYLTPEGEVSQYAYGGESKGRSGGLLSNWVVVCERLANDPAERAYASIMGSLEKDIADGKARQKELGEKKRNLENELLALKIKQVLGLYSAETSLKMRELCFRLYDSYTDSLRLERKAYGSTGHRRNFTTFVYHDVQKRNTPRNKQCGYWFADQLGKHPKALQYAVVDFTVFHTLNERDIHSAEMLQLIYSTGRGSSPDPSSAKKWETEVKRRRSAAAGG